MRMLILGFLRGLEYAGIIRLINDNENDIWVVEYNGEKWDIQVYPH